MRIIRFGTRGWRARYDDGFDEASVTRIAEALAMVWSDSSPHGVVYVGYDTRRDARELAVCAAQVMAASGLEVKVSQVSCPTPALGWTISRDPDAVGGISVTASESPCEYGGIIVRMADGSPAPPVFLRQVEGLISSTPATARGSVEFVDIMGSYIQELLDHANRSLIGSAALSIVVDPMYGAGSGRLASVLENLGCQVSEVHGGVREDFGGIHPDPVEPWVDDCESAVKLSHAQMGLVLDGDADRLGLVDERGAFIAPKYLIPLVMDHLVRNRHTTGRIVATQSCSRSIRTMAERLDCDFTETPLGFSRLYGEMRDGDVLLATEEYGGVCLPQHFCERDAFVEALLVVEMVAAAGRPVSDLVARLKAEIGTYEYGKRDIRLDYGAVATFRALLPGLNPPKFAGRVPREVMHGDGLKLIFEDGSWTMLRPSATEPVVRVYAEAATPELRDQLLKAGVELVGSY